MKQELLWRLADHMSVLHHFSDSVGFMNTWLIIVGTFIGLSILSSILIVAACIRSSQISRELEISESNEVYSRDKRVPKEGKFPKESATAWS